MKCVCVLVHTYVCPQVSAVHLKYKCVCSLLIRVNEVVETA